jgi:hypothetical protein
VSEETKVRDKNTIWMVISGATGFSFFLIANFTNIFIGLSVTAGILQLFVNAFVAIVWGKAFIQSSGLKKFVAFVGTVVPAIMASITIVRVILPALHNV